MTQVSQLSEAFNAGAFDSILSKLYGSENRVLRRQRERYAGTICAFGEKFGRDRDVSVYSAPGRTELCGNHTDHNGGIVMAAAVNVDIIAVVSKAKDDTVRIFSKEYASGMDLSLSNLNPVKAEIGKSSAMVRGVAAGFKKRGGITGGFDAFTSSEVIKGSGLSSSAAFEICVGGILNGEYNKDRFMPVELAAIGQHAENAYFGKPSGLMDQIACAVGGVVSIDFKNQAAPLVTKVPFDLAGHGYKLVITDTKGSHARLTDEYGTIRDEMESVARFLGKENLREAGREAFFSQIGNIRRKTGDRAVLRALHFFEECRRVEELAGAAGCGDIRRCLNLILESGHSSFEYNQNAYSLKSPNRQGISLALALSQLVLQRKGAWRLQGGGFAGTIQAFVPDRLLNPYRSALSGAFGKNACQVLSFREKGLVQAAKLCLK